MASWAGERGRIGGVPNRGGELPNDSLSADERFDSDGPGSDECGSARPGRGVCIEGEFAVCEGVGIWRMAGEPLGREGIDEPSLAVELARMDWASAGELWRDPRAEDDDAAGGFEDEERSAAILGRVVYREGIEAEPVAITKVGSFAYLPVLVQVCKAAIQGTCRCTLAMQTGSRCVSAREL